MRQTLLDLINKTVTLKYTLPNKSLYIEKSKFTTRNDDCYESLNDAKLSEIIYNLIIEYSFTEFDITQNSYDNLLQKALQTKLKYNSNYTESQKIKFGFYGEVLLYGMLYAKYNSKPLISRGYFYNIGEDAETKGYDCYHLVEHNGRTELWFGETKFMSSFPTCIDSVFSNINKALSNEYLCKKNLLAIIDKKDKISIKNSTIEKIIEKWDSNPAIQLENEIKNFNIELVYPIFLTSKKLETYDKTIKNAIEKINKMAITSKLCIPYTLFFIFLPITNVNEVKRSVIEWIESKKPLLS